LENISRTSNLDAVEELMCSQFGEHFKNEIDLKLTNGIVRNRDHLDNFKGELNWRSEQLVAF
jgi:hypothetical protein